MQKYDVALKNVLTRGACGFLSRLLGLEIAQFLNTELPMVRNQRADLLMEAHDGTLLHVELQSSNEPRIAIRMLDYLVAIESKFERIPRQLVLYVGEAPMRMNGRIAAASLSFEVPIMDIRDIDGEPLLESDNLEENILSILARQSDTKQAVRRIMEKIAASDPDRQKTALQELAILSGLRSSGSFVKEESERMPITADIMDHDLFGPMIREGMAKGRVEGLAEGERTILRKLITKRFGEMPNWAVEKFNQFKVEELEDIGVRLLDTQTIEELFNPE